MISRRQFLAGALATGTAAALGTFEWFQHPSLRTRLGLANSPDINITDHHVSVKRGTLNSAHMKTNLHWALTSPPNAVATVFCLHGRGDGYDEPFTTLHLPDIVAEANLPLSIASVQGGDHSYWTDEMTALMPVQC